MNYSSEMSEFTTRQLAWLLGPVLDPEGKPYPSVQAYSEVVDLPLGKGNVTMEKLVLPLGATFSRNKYKPNPSQKGNIFPLDAFICDFGMPVFYVHTMRIGKLFSHELYPDLDVAISPGQDLFCNHRVRHCVPYMDGTHAAEMVGFGLSVEGLQGLFGQAGTGDLLRALMIEEPPAVCVQNIPRSINSILHSALSNTFMGGLRHTHALAKGIEYLSALYSFLIAVPPMEHKKGKLREAVHSLHDYLLNMDGKLPKLENLAEQFGYPPHALHLAFKEHYGESIFSFTTGNRLKQARDAIMVQDIPLKVLAMRLGYSHVNHFNSAFKRYFHVSPGSLRPGKKGG